MEIETDTPELEQTRYGILEMLLRRYPAHALRAFPDKPFHQEIHRAGLMDRAAECVPNLARTDRSHPYIAVDMARCIDCYRCVRICAEVQGQFVWHVRERGLKTAIEPDGPTLLRSSCVSCGACVDACPTGALEDKSVSPLAEPSRSGPGPPVHTVASAVSSTSARRRQHRGGRASARRTGQQGHLCVKGRYAFGFVSATDRILEPMIRDGSEWRRVAWSEVRAFVIERLRTLIERHGPDSVGVLGSARATNEENYLTQKFARAVLGTNNVDCCARVCHAPAPRRSSRRSAPASPPTHSMTSRSPTPFSCGANATEDHPIVGARIKQAALRGARLIVIDPRRIELANYADCHVALTRDEHRAAQRDGAHDCRRRPRRPRIPGTTRVLVRRLRDVHSSLAS